LAIPSSNRFFCSRIVGWPAAHLFVGTRVGTAELFEAKDDQATWTGPMMDDQTGGCRYNGAATSGSCTVGYLPTLVGASGCSAAAFSSECRVE
jgi:hypothetical protein